MTSIAQLVLKSSNLLLNKKQEVAKKNPAVWYWSLSVKAPKLWSSAVLTSYLLAQSVAVPLSAQLDKADSLADYQTDIALMYYAEDARVSALEPVISIKKTELNEDTVTYKIVLDSLTGASPTGAIASPTAVTYSRPSGSGSYETKAGDIPLDDTFKDSRLALSASWLKNLKADRKFNFGVGFSNEYDYTSLSFNGGMNWELGQGNHNWLVAGSLAFDTIAPVGGIKQRGDCMGAEDQINGCSNITVKTYGTPLGSLKNSLINSLEEDNDNNSDFVRTNGGITDDSKTIIDLIAGYTRTVNAKTLLQTGLSLSMANGYQNDPYKVVSVIDTDGSTTLGIGSAERHLYENRPTSRTKTAGFVRWKQWIDDKVLDASVRLLTDDWGLVSQTSDVKLRLIYSSWYIQPRLRYYTQSEIDYFVHYLTEDQVLPKYFTADERQGSFSATTIGAEFGINPGAGRAWRVSIESYQQQHDELAQRVGVLANLPLTQDLSAIVLRANYQY